MASEAKRPECPLGIELGAFHQLTQTVNTTGVTVVETRNLVLSLYEKLETRIENERMTRQQQVDDLSKTVNRWAGGLALLYVIGLALIPFVVMMVERK